MRSNTFKCAAAVLLFATLGASAEEPQPEHVQASMGNGVLSPTVVASWTVRKEGNASWQLQFLVLWRGSPGWFSREDSNSSSGSSSMGGDEVTVEKLSYGGIDLTLEFDGNKRIARVQDQEVPLGSDNVILVDDVDGAAGPRVQNSLAVDGQLSDETSAVETIIRRNPELYAFLRCDAPLPDAATQSMIDAVCARMEPK